MTPKRLALVAGSVDRDRQVEHLPNTAGVPGVGSDRIRCPAAGDHLVENASDDGSAEMVEKDFPVARPIRNPENVGFAAANNQAFEVAQGRMVLLLNSDTLVRGDVIAKSIQYLSDNPDVGGMGCRVLNTDETVQYTCAMFPSLLNLFLQFTGLRKLSWPKFFGRYHMTFWQRDSTRSVETISGCYLLVRSEIIETIGPLAKHFSSSAKKPTGANASVIPDGAWISPRSERSSIMAADPRSN